MPGSADCRGEAFAGGYASFSIATDAFVVASVPPTSAASPMAAAEEWFLIVRTSPAAMASMTCPMFCWVPAPEP